MKATRDFVERFEKNRLYKKGEPYVFDNKARADYLKENGYLEEDKSKEEVPSELDKDEEVVPTKKAKKKKSGE